MHLLDSQFGTIVFVLSRMVLGPIFKATLEHTLYENFINSKIMFGNYILNSVLHFEQVNTLISKFLVFDNFAFGLAFQVSF